MNVVAVSCVSAWLGITAFFSFGVAPLVFNVMERTAAGQVAAAELPRYSSVTLNGVTMLAAVATLALDGFRRTPKVAGTPRRPR
jgi:hypothetical protein